jgi:hypothetical protein
LPAKEIERATKKQNQEHHERHCNVMQSFLNSIRIAPTSIVSLSTISRSCESTHCGQPDPSDANRESLLYIYIISEVAKRTSD